MRHLISLKEQKPKDIRQMLNMAAELKKQRSSGKSLDILNGKKLLMVFEKNSGRTRVTYSSAMLELGGHSIIVDKQASQINSGNSKY